MNTFSDVETDKIIINKKQKENNKNVQTRSELNTLRQTYTWDTSMEAKDEVWSAAKVRKAERSSSGSVQTATQAHGGHLLWER